MAVFTAKKGNLKIEQIGFKRDIAGAISRGEATKNSLITREFRFWQCFVWCL